MNPYRARKVAKVIALVIALVMIITSFSFVMMVPGLFGMEGSVVYAAATSDEIVDQDLESLKEYMRYIKENYKDDVSYNQMIEGAYAGIVESLGDPYSIYYGASEAGKTFVENVTGVFSGIGVNVENYNGQCRVVAPISGTPAEKSGIKSGDIVIKVDGMDVTSKTLNEIVSLMRGETGTKVTVTVSRGGQEYSFTLTRAIVKNISVNYKMLEGNIGYIQITSFDSDTNDEFEAALAEVVKQGAKSLILDERNNPGGLVNMALDIANDLMPKGPIMHFEQRGKILETYSADGDRKVNLPIVLLVNEGSASASEILAGALQDSKTAKLVGTTTFGKGVAQQIFDFNDGTSMKLSMFYFLTPNKNKIDHIGIKPDYTVQNTVNADAEKLAAEYSGFAPMSEKVKPKAGSVGLNVFGAQQRLSMIGYSVKATGTMDTATVEAVKKFQKESGFYSSGVLDYTTMGALDKSTIEFITGVKNTRDLQLEKAVELLK